MNILPIWLISEENGTGQYPGLKSQKNFKEEHPPDPNYGVEVMDSKEQVK